MAAIEPKTVILKNGIKACIRNRTLEDSEKAIKYALEIFQDDHFFLSALEEIQEKATIERTNEQTELFNSHNCKLLLIAEIDGQIVSFSDVQCGKKKRNQHVAQTGLSILPEYRGIGLGTAVMQTMIDWAAAHPVIEKLALSGGVWAKNAPAIALYKKMGFIDEGRKIKEVKYADGSYDDMICMYRFVK